MASHLPSLERVKSNAKKVLRNVTMAFGIGTMTIGALNAQSADHSCIHKCIPVPIQQDDTNSANTRGTCDEYVYGDMPVGRYYRNPADTIGVRQMLEERQSAMIKHDIDQALLASGNPDNIQTENLRLVPNFYQMDIDVQPGDDINDVIATLNSDADSNPNHPWNESHPENLARIVGVIDDIESKGRGTLSGQETPSDSRQAIITLNQQSSSSFLQDPTETYGEIQVNDTDKNIAHELRHCLARLSGDHSNISNPDPENAYAYEFLASQPNPANLMLGSIGKSGTALSSPNSTVPGMMIDHVHPVTGLAFQEQVPNNPLYRVAEELEATIKTHYETYLCDSTPLDSDGDGTPDDQDCEPNNPALPTTPGTTCDDGNPNTVNDVILGDGCTCEGTEPGSTMYAQDNDGDMYIKPGSEVSKPTGSQSSNEIPLVDASGEECSIETDLDPSLPAEQGTTCDDENPNTENDVILNDGCTCEGEIIIGTTNIDDQSVITAIPNPVQAGSLLTIKGVPDGTPFNMYTMQGKIVDSGIYQNNIQVDQNLTKGIYAIQLIDTKDKKGNAVVKVAVQ